MQLCYFCVYKFPAFCIILVRTNREIFEIPGTHFDCIKHNITFFKELHKLQQPKRDMYIYVCRSFLYSTNCEDIKMKVMKIYGLMHIICIH